MTKQEFDNIIEAIGIRADDGLYEAVNAALNSLDVLDEFDGDTQ